MIKSWELGKGKLIGYVKNKFYILKKKGGVLEIDIFIKQTKVSQYNMEEGMEALTKRDICRHIR
jgi:hypothetical protein